MQKVVGLIFRNYGAVVEGVAPISKGVGTFALVGESRRQWTNLTSRGPEGTAAAPSLGPFGLFCYLRKANFKGNVGQIRDTCTQGVGGMGMSQFS